MSELAALWVVLALDTSLKGALVAFCVALLLWFFRVRDCNVSHRVWSGVLAGMLTLPFLTHVVPALRLPFVPRADWLVLVTQHETAPHVSENVESDSPLVATSISDPAPELHGEAAVANERFDEFGDGASRNPFPDRIDSFPASGAAPWTMPTNPQQGLGASEIATKPIGPNGMANEPNAVALTEEPLPAKSPSSNSILGLWRSWPMILTSVWLAGAAVMALRLLLGVVIAARLRRASMPIELALLEDLGLDPRRLPDTPQPLLVCECAQIRVPMALGVWRPIVLLPVEWMDWPVAKLQAVLTHERMHVARADCLVTLLAEINRCLYWFHPLGWWLPHKLSVLAEEACDDAAIDSTGDRAEYARHLLEVAAVVAREKGRVMAAGVSMARRSDIESRIHAILDLTRPLSRRLTWGSMLALFCLLVPLITLAAALQPALDSQPEAAPDRVAEQTDSGDDPAADAPKTDVVDANEELQIAAAEQQPAVPAKSEPESKSYTFAGKVVDDRGELVSGAKVWLSSIGMGEGRLDEVPNAVTDSLGRFEFSDPSGDLTDRDEVLQRRSGGLIATKPGHGFAYGSAVHFETTGRLKEALGKLGPQFAAEDATPPVKVLKFVSDEKPVRGRILNTEGQPVAGAKVLCAMVWGGKKGTLDAWERAAKEPLADIPYAHGRNLDVLLVANHSTGHYNAIVPTVETGADGWFTLTGLGTGRLMDLIVSGPGIETGQLHVRSVAGETIQLHRNRQIDDFPAESFYPVEFSHVAGPSIPVGGQVTDVASGVPLADMVVAITKIATDPVTGSWSERVMRTRTDAEGRYQLTGLPLGKNTVSIYPPAGSSYLAGSADTKSSIEDKSVVRDIKLFRGVLIRGQATDAKSGKPLRGELQYFAFLTNPHLQEASSFKRSNLPHWHYRTGPDGRFAIPALPGKGILAFDADNRGDYRYGVGADSIDGPKTAHRTGSQIFSTEPHFCDGATHHLLTGLDLSTTEAEFQVDLRLGNGATFAGSVLDPDGQALDDHYIYGIAYGGWRRHRGDSFEVKDYFPEQGRRLMFYHPGRELAGLMDVKGAPPEKLEIKLQPAAKFVGRVVDRDGTPQENLLVYNLFYRTDSPAPAPESPDFNRGEFPARLDGKQLATDAEGRFELRGIIPGLKYSARVLGPGEQGSMTKRILGTIFTEATAQPGETKQLGDLRITENRPNASPKADAEPQPRDSKTASASVNAASSTEAAASSAAPPASSESAKSEITIRGVVLKPDGKPAAGAVVRAAAPLWPLMEPFVGKEFKSPLTETTADSDGKFSIRFPRQPFADVRVLNDYWPEVWKKTQIAASLAGYGPAWVTYDGIDAAQRLTLRLVEDLPIRGRVIDLEGRPIIGTTVKISGPQSAKDQDLSEWIAGVKRGESAWTVNQKIPLSLEPRLAGTPSAVKTDGDGRFEIRGFGRERIVSLTFEGEQVAHRNAKAVTREMEPIPQVIDTSRYAATETVFGATFTFSADPARTIEGVVRDVKSGEPLPGVSVESEKLAGSPFGYNRVLKTTTDKEGRFRLLGMPKGVGNRLLIVPNAEQPYFMHIESVPDPAGLGPARVEIDLHRGIWISGKVTDLATGTPVPGVEMHYLPFRTNEFARITPEFRDDGNVDGVPCQTKTDGTYRLVGLPGRAVVGAKSVLKGFRKGVGFREVRGPGAGGSDELETYRSPMKPSLRWPNMILEINPAADSGPVTLDFALDPGQSLQIRVQGPDGHPITGVQVSGLSDAGFIGSTQEPVLTATNFGPEDLRMLIFRHLEKKLARILRIGPEERRAAELTVVLEPEAFVVGRLVDEGDEPLSGTLIKPWVLPDRDLWLQPAVAVDAEGRFRIPLITGCAYALQGQASRSDTKLMITKDLEIEPGETKDLGTLKFDKNGKLIQSAMKDDKPKTTSTGAAPAASSSAAKPSTSEITVRGVVLKPDGKPAAGATVRAAAPGAMPESAVGRKFESPLTETTTDVEGRFTIRFSTEPFGDVSALDDRWRETWKKTQIAASLAGYGPAWMNYDRIADAKSLTLQLVEDLPIRGRVIDLEGRPIVGTTVKISGPRAAPRAGENPAIASPTAIDSRLVGTPTAVTTKHDGTFEIRGIGKERMVRLVFEGEHVAYRIASAVTRDMEPTREPSGKSASPRSQPLFGATFTFIADPARTIEGVVRDAKTGEPIPGVSVESERLIGSSFSSRHVFSFTNIRPLKTTTDQEGRFRLLGMPKGAGNQLMIIPNDDQPYFMRQVDVPDPVGLGPAQMEIELHRGIWISGKVTDKGTGAPVPGVRLHYFPFRTNEHAQRTAGFTADGSVDGDQGRYQTKADGTYRLVGLPGLAVVGAESTLKTYRKGAGYREITGPKMKNSDQLDTYQNPVNPSPNWLNVIRQIDPPADSAPLTLDFALDPGQSVRIRVQDPDGTPITGLEVQGLSASSRLDKTDDAMVTATNLGSDDVRVLLFKHAEKRLGRVVRIGPAEVAAGEMTVQLQPEAYVIGRLFDDEGEPFSGATIEPRVMPFGELWGRLPSIRADADGRFRVPLIPGSRYSLYGESSRPAMRTLWISQKLEIEPGETKDLGTLKFDKNGKLIQSAVKDDKPKTTSTGAAPAASSSAPNSATSEITVRGVVLKPDGKPAAGAVVRAAAMAEWSSWELAVAKDLNSPLSEAIADAQGMFSIRFPRHPYGDVSGFDQRWRDIHKTTQIAASLAGYGPAWVTYGAIDASQLLTLRLVEDLPLRGRVIDLEGRPIAGTSVKVSAPQAAKDDDLSEWIAAVKAGEIQWTVQQKVPRSVEPRLIGTPTAVTTDADGRFEIRGVGRERVVLLTFAGEQVACREAQAVTRDMETLQQIIGFGQFEGKEPVFGATFTFSAEPARTVEGIVKDAKTGEPLPGVSVQSCKLAGFPFTKYRVLNTTTDKSGRFRLIGMPKGAENRLWIVPNDQQPYFMRDVDVPDPVGLGPARMEIEMHRGIWITGKVTDKATGAAIPTVRMLYMPFLTNGFAQRTPEFHADSGFVDGEARQTRFQSKADGTYRIVGLPGPAIVGAESILKSYRWGVGYADITGPKVPKSDLFDTYRGPMKPGRKWPNMMKEIDPPADTGPVTLDFALDPGQSLRIHVQGPDGKPITGLDVHGLSSVGSGEKKDDSELTATNLGPDAERPILFRHVEKRLGQVVRIGPDELAAGEITVKLQPEAHIVGRLLDEDGEPLSGTEITASGVPFDWATRLDAVGADADGRFRVVLIPGCRYSLVGKPNRREMYELTIAKDLTVEPGETKDLGTMKFNKKGKLVPSAMTDAKPKDAAVRAAPAASSTAKKSSESANTLRGIVQKPDGKPAPGARLYWLRQNLPQRVIYESSEWVEGAKADSAGRFEFDLPARDFKATSPAMPILAAADGFGVDWAMVPYGEKPGELTLRLVEDVPVRGRILDSEGRPVAGAKVSIAHLFAATTGTIDQVLSSYREVADEAYGSMAKQLSPAWNGGPFPGGTTDAAGRFEFHGLGAERAAGIMVRAPSIAQTRINVVLREGVDLKPVNDEVTSRWSQMVRPGRPTLLYPPQFDFVGELAQTVEGIVHEASTGKPIAGAVVRGNAGYGGYIMSTTDAEGRYRLGGMTTLKPKYELIFQAPAGSQWLNHRVVLPNQKGLTPIRVDVDLTRGIMIRGRVIDRATGAGIPSAIRLVPLPENSFADLPIYQGKDLANFEPFLSPDGSFSLVSIPGPVAILARELSAQKVNGTSVCVYRRAEFNEEDRKRIRFTLNGDYFASKAGTNEPLKLFNAAKVLDLDEKAESVECDLYFGRGKTLDVVLKDPEGRPLDGALIAGMAEVIMGGTEAVAASSDGRTTLYALDPAKPRPVIFYHPERALVATLTAKADKPQPLVVTLQPVPTLKGRLVDRDGMPLAETIINCRASSNDAAWELYRYLQRNRQQSRGDKDGRFVIQGPIVAETFELEIKTTTTTIIPKEMHALRTKVLQRGNAPGTIVDLGDIVCAP